MAYTESYRIQFHDAGHNDILRPSLLWRYMQETANRQMLTEKPSFRQLLEDGYAFVLSRMRLVSYSPLRPYDAIRVETWDCGGKGASHIRCYRLYRGEILAAEADSVWALVRIADRTLTRVGEVPLGYSRGEPLSLPLPDRLHLPEEAFAAVGSRDIRLSDVDCLGHMNNTNYPDMLWDFVPQGDSRVLKSLMLDYRHDAPLSSRIAITRLDAGDTFYFRTYRENSINVEARFETTLLPEGWGPPPFATEKF